MNWEGAFVSPPKNGFRGEPRECSVSSIMLALIRAGSELGTLRVARVAVLVKAKAAAARLLPLQCHSRPAWLWAGRLSAFPSSVLVTCTDGVSVGAEALAQTKTRRPTLLLTVSPARPRSQPLSVTSLMTP